MPALPGSSEKEPPPIEERIQTIERLAVKIRGELARLGIHPKPVRAPWEQPTARRGRAPVKVLLIWREVRGKDPTELPPDHVIAAACGCSPHMVQQVRKKLGIMKLGLVKTKKEEGESMGRGEQRSGEDIQKIEAIVKSFLENDRDGYTDEKAAAEALKLHHIDIAASGVAAIRKKAGIMFRKSNGSGTNGPVKSAHNRDTVDGLVAIASQHMLNVSTEMSAALDAMGELTKKLEERPRQFTDKEIEAIKILMPSLFLNRK